MSKKSIKDLFDVAQSHGPNYVDDNPRIKKQVQVSRGINKNFARNLLLVLRTDVVFYFSTTNVYKKGASPCAGTCKYSCTRSKKNVLKFLKPYGPVCVDR